MNQFELAKKILLKIVLEDTNFNLAKRNAYHKYNIDPVTRSNINALLGCELRHHYVCDNLIARFFDDVEFEKTIYLRFAIVNHQFMRRFSEQELMNLAKQDLDPDKVQALINFIDSTHEIIPQELDKTSPEFLALRYNTPAWVIRMWQKQYGKGLVFKVLKANYRQSIPCFRVNTNKINLDDFVAKHPDYSKSPIEGMIVYQGREGSKPLEELKTHEIFQMRMATKFVLDQLDLDPFKGIAIYSEVKNNMLLDLMIRFGNELNLDLIINLPSFYFEARRFVQENGLPHTYVYESAASGLITCLSKKVHTFICMPKSTVLDNLRSSPDYFLRVKQEQLDEVIAYETDALEEASKFVENDGELVYMIPTLSRKESNNLVANFLVKHPEFTLMEERQFFPFEIYDSCLYYARLKKVEEPSD